MKSNEGHYIRKCWLVLFLQFYFQKKIRFYWKKKPFKKIEEKLNYIDKDDIGNLEDSRILVLIDW